MTVSTVKTYGVADEAAKLFIIPAAEALRHRDGKAAAKAKAEADDEERDGAGGANGCKRPRAKHAPDDHGIDHGIELLEQIAEKQRDGEPEDKLHGRTARHFFCHTENFTPLREK